MSMIDNSLQQAVAELVGKSSRDLKLRFDGPNPVKDLRAGLSAIDFDVEENEPLTHVKTRHVVLYGDAQGYVRAILSDSSEAASVTPIGRLTITKADKKASEPKAS